MRRTFASVAADMGYGDATIAELLGHARRGVTERHYMRRSDPVLSRAGRCRPEGAVLGPGAFLLRYVDWDHGDRLLLFNFECDLDFTPAREPLIAPPFARRWRLVWSSESPEYGGQGTPPLKGKAWLVPGGCALLFVPEAR